jgi:tRNA wybutosine-synthesizing protein 1
MNPVHCALSLVGEPIMYPEINRFLRMLHDKKISSFLVTNAQFPEAIRQLEPCTQLYVSVDASTKDSLKRIDRPLFKGILRRRRILLYMCVVVREFSSIRFLGEIS